MRNASRNSKGRRQKAEGRVRELAFELFLCAMIICTVYVRVLKCLFLGNSSGVVRE